MWRLLCLAVALSVAQLVWAETRYNKEWAWDTSNADFAYAATVNDDGRVLGQYCYYSQSTCIYIVSFGITCEQGGEYPALINSNLGAVEVRLVCGHDLGKENAFYIKPFETIDGTIKDATNIGFAIAMESGYFKVVRFSLAGSTYAIESMRSYVEERDNSKREGFGGGDSEQYL